jgi:hypothetical protein
MVFVADDPLGRAFDGRFDHEITNETSSTGFGDKIQDAKPRKAGAVGSHVLVSCELDASTYIKLSGPSMGGSLQRGSVSYQIFGYQILVTILTATQVVQVMLARVDDVA